MTDYTLGIGGGSTMMIRDLGWDVEFWFITGPSTWNNNQWWSWAANGTSSRQQFALLRGGNWQHVGTITVTYDQDIRFTMEGSGLGWATTDFWQHITRSTIPQPPTLEVAEAVSDTEIHVVFVGGPDGGSPILEWQVGFGTSLTIGPEDFRDAGSSGDEVYDGFNPGQREYVWVRGRNAVGWSDWSNRGEALLWKVPPPPKNPTFPAKTQSSFTVKYKIADVAGNTPTLERQLGYATTNTTPTNFMSDMSGVYTVTGLTPGGTYYVWSRYRNSLGWGAWSASTRVDLVAGAMVLVGGVWKRAVPYVRVGGVWKLAEPWVKNAGTWGRT
jgi:hypothetical protein